MASEQPDAARSAHQTERFVGGMRYGAKGGPLSGGAYLTRPLAVLELDDDKVSVSPRGVLRKALNPVEFPVASVTGVESRFGFSKTGIRFRSEGPEDGIVFWPRRRDKSAVVEAIRRRGLRVA